MNTLKKVLQPLLGFFAILLLSLSAFSSDSETGKRELLRMIEEDQADSFACTFFWSTLSHQDEREIFRKMAEKNNLRVFIKKTFEQNYSGIFPYIENLIKIDENDPQVILTAETSHGVLELKKLLRPSIQSIEEKIVPEMEEEQTFSDEETFLVQRTIAAPYYPIEAYESDDEDIEQEEVIEEIKDVLPPESAVKELKKKARRSPHYVDWNDYEGLRETQFQKDDATRQRRKFHTALQKIEEQRADNERAPIKPKAPAPLETLPLPQERSHEVHSTIKLSPFSHYEECGLVGETIADSTWFGEGYALVNNHLHRLQKNLVIGMRSWQGYPQIAANAAWGSLMATDLGERNFIDGKNVHISYHEQKYDDQLVRYLNISHHYRFELQKDEASGDYVLYQLEPKGNFQIVYILSKGISQRKLAKVKKKKELTLAQMARIHIRWNIAWQEELEQRADVELLNMTAYQIEHGLRASGKDIVLNSRMKLP